ncbi:hypothetical protein RGQ29_022131 [Quercus rubra]|uniref:AB hydrolase-1 domain-containing protein n=1 Tax=Quercus rubra TaxID=3512 RepID=A0AAN7F2T8_QUERU|nr:hypothetical protein RGQ29_022131 [Quercus rubra]
MVNFVAALRPMVRWLMKIAGVQPYTVEIEPGTVMNFWVPLETLKKKPSKKGDKPAVVLVQGFFSDGIMTWLFQAFALSKQYSVYIPDLLFFGGSITDKTDRSPRFQAECLAAGLRKLGVERCTVVGFSYGGTVAFKMAELHADLVEAVVVSGSVIELTDSTNETMLQNLGYSSVSEMLLPTSVKALKRIISLALHKKLWLPDRFYKDFLEVMYTNRKERGELLEAFVISNKDFTVPNFPQMIHILWGENDRLLKLEIAQNLKGQLGENASFQGINKAGHLVHLEHPCVYSRCLKQFLASLHEDKAQK